MGPFGPSSLPHYIKRCLLYRQRLITAGLGSLFPITFPLQPAISRSHADFQRWVLNGPNMTFTWGRSEVPYIHSTRNEEVGGGVGGKYIFWYQ